MIAQAQRCGDCRHFIAGGCTRFHICATEDQRLCFASFEPRIKRDTGQRRRKSDMIGQGA